MDRNVCVCLHVLRDRCGRGGGAKSGCCGFHGTEWSGGPEMIVSEELPLGNGQRMHVPLEEGERGKEIGLGDSRRARAGVSEC